MDDDIVLKVSDYPLSVNRPDLLTTPSGKSFGDLTIEGVMDGTVTAEDLRTSPHTLRLQASIADAAGRSQLADNLRRAAELTPIPDEKVLEIYNALRPNASTRQELDAIADDLESTYSASHSAALVREAAEVYERRGVLLAE